MIKSAPSVQFNCVLNETEGAEVAIAISSKMSEGVKAIGRTFICTTARCLPANARS